MWRAVERHPAASGRNQKAAVRRRSVLRLIGCSATNEYKTSDGDVRPVSSTGNSTVTAAAPVRSIRGVRIRTYATVGLRETATARSSIDDREQPHNGQHRKPVSPL